MEVIFVGENMGDYEESQEVSSKLIKKLNNHLLT